MPIEPPPKPTKLDRIGAVVTAGASAVPVVGGPLDHLLAAIFGAPLSRRTYDWQVKLVEVLNGIAARQDVAVEEVTMSPLFESAVFEASRIAIGEHLEEKLDMLKAVLQHTELDPGRADIVTMRYLRYVDELDVDHVLVLRYAADPVGWFESHGIPRQEYLSGGRAQILEDAHLGIAAEVVELVLEDLATRQLAAAGALNGMVTGRAMYDPWITARGREWLDWITVV